MAAVSCLSVGAMAGVVAASARAPVASRGGAVMKVQVQPARASVGFVGGAERRALSMGAARARPSTRGGARGFEVVAMAISEVRSSSSSSTHPRAESCWVSHASRRKAGSADKPLT